MVAILSKLIAAAMVMAIFALLRNLPAFRAPRQHLTPAQAALLVQRYAVWEGVTVLALIVGIVFSTWLSYQVLNLVAGWYLSLWAEPLYLLTVSRLAWLLPAIAMGIMGGMVIQSQCMWLLLGDRVGELREMLHHRYRVHWQRLGSALYGVMLAMATILCLGMLWTSASFYENQIRLSEALSAWPQEFEYEQIRRLGHVRDVRAPSGNWVDRPHYVIELDDGTLWGTSWYFRSPQPQADRELFNFLAAKTGHEIEELRHWPEVGEGGKEP